MTNNFEAQPSNQIINILDHKATTIDEYVIKHEVTRKEIFKLLMDKMPEMFVFLQIMSSIQLIIGNQLENKMTVKGLKSQHQ